jgi:hypothetical protein
MKKQIITNIRELDLNCSANAQLTPIPPPALIADHLGKVVPEPLVALVEAVPVSPVTVAIAPAPDQNPPPTTP